MKCYAAYKDSGIEWIGEIPAGWITTSLKRIATYTRGSGIQRGEAVQGGKPCVRYGELYTTYSGTILEPASFIPGALWDASVKLGEDDLVMSLTGETKEDIGPTSVNLSGRTLAVGGDTLVIRPANQDGRFLAYALNSNYTRIQKCLAATGEIIIHLGAVRVGNLAIVLPSLAEQEAIADYLDAKTAEIDALVADCEQEAELLREYRRSLISEAVTKGLNPNVPMEDSGAEWIGEIPAGWDVSPLKVLFSFGKGLPITKADLADNGVPVISYGQIHSKSNTPAHIDNSFIRFVPESFMSANSASLTQQGDFLFADTSEDVEGSGNFVYHDQAQDIFAGYHTLVLAPNNRRFGRYLSYLFQSDEWRSQIRSRVSGVKLYSLTQRILGDVSTLLPPPPEQEAIADYLDAKTAEIDALVADCEQEAELLREYRRSLISEAVTGKFKVPGVNA